MWNKVCDRCESILFLLHPFEHRAIAYRTLYRGTFVRCNDSRTWNVSSWNCTIWTAWSTCHIFWTRLVKQNYITNESNVRSTYFFLSININEWMEKKKKWTWTSCRSICNTIKKYCHKRNTAMQGDALLTITCLSPFYSCQPFKCLMTFLNQTKQIHLKWAPNKLKIHKFTLPVPSHSHLIKTRARKRNSYQ